MPRGDNTAYGFAYVRVTYDATQIAQERLRRKPQTTPTCQHDHGQALQPHGRARSRDEWYSSMHADILGAPWPQATPHLALRASREAKDTLARPSLRARLNIALSCKLWTDDRHHDDFPVSSSNADERRCYADDPVLSKKHKTQQISTDNTCEVPIARAGTVAT